MDGSLNLKNYVLKLADDSLIFGQRLAEWCGQGPYLEEDIALTNIALDYLGQSSNFYSCISELELGGPTEDELAFLRYEHQYLNCQLVELPVGDYANTILKVYFFSVYQNVLLENLQNSTDERLSALSAKSLKEAKYHLIHARTWVEIFSKGTHESRMRIENALSELWGYTGGLFEIVEGEKRLTLSAVVPDADVLKEKWYVQVVEDFQKWDLKVPENPFQHLGGRQGRHTEYFGYLLCELQYMQRAYPGCQW